MIPRFVAKLKTAPRGCLNQLSRRSELPPSLTKLINVLTSANTVALRLSPTEPAIKYVVKLENLLSYALQCIRKFHGVSANGGVYEALGRVRRLLTVSVRMATPLIEAMEDTLSDSEDEDGTDKKSGCEENDSESESGIDSESESGTESESGSDESDEECEAEEDKSHMATEKTITQCSPQHPSYKRKSDLREQLSEFLWNARREVERRQQCALNGTRKQGLKSKESTPTQVRTNLAKCCKALSASKLSSMVKSSDLVTLVSPTKKVLFSTTVSVIPPAKVANSSTSPLCPIAAAKPIPMTQPEPTDELVKSFDSFFDNSLYKFAKTMGEISEQFSRSSVCESTFASHPKTTATDLPHKQLRDGSVTFVLYASRLTKVIEERKKTGEQLFKTNLCTGQVEVRKSTSPIRESKLTPILSSNGILLSSVKLFAEKMHQAMLSNRVILTAKRCGRSRSTTRFSTIAKKPIIDVVKIEIAPAEAPKPLQRKVKLQHITAIASEIYNIV